jgi:hypothetical protein
VSNYPQHLRGVVLSALNSLPNLLQSAAVMSFLELERFGGELYRVFAFGVGRTLHCGFARA